MFKAFDLKEVESNGVSYIDRLLLIQEGKKVLTQNKELVQRTLHTIVDDKATLDGRKIRESWFPQVKADVFLSHSHQDEEEVLLLAGWLKEKFGLNAFVDSAIWGYAGDLLRLVDNRFCYQPESETYSYERRNESTSHVHMILMTALGMMIHKTECLMFVNTPASIAAQDVTAQTNSPWIYAELTVAGVIEEVMPDRLRREKRSIEAKARSGEMLKESEERRVKFIHTVDDMGRLMPITWKTLQSWAYHCNSKGPESLDTLYEIASR